MSTINVNLVSLKAMLHAAAVKDIRYYLNGVKIEASHDETRYIATDGHMMAIHQETIANDGIERGTVVEFIIATDTIKSLPVNKKNPYAEFTYGENGDTGLRIDYLGESRTVRTVDGKFPDYCRVIPSTVSNEPACYNPDLLARAAKIFKELHGSKLGMFHLGQNGSSSAVAFDDNPDLLVVIAPWRTNDDPQALTMRDWVKRKPGQSATQVKEAEPEKLAA